MHKDKIGELRALREDVLEISRAEFADKIGVCESSIKNWELKKNNPSPLATEKIIKFLGSLRKAKGKGDATPK